MTTVISWRFATLILVELFIAVAAGGDRPRAGRLSADSPVSGAHHAAQVRGTCWLRVEPGGRCSAIYEVNVTRAECCAMEPGSASLSDATGWAPYVELTSRQYFSWVVLGRGVPDCQPCRTSCDNFRCGPRKVCRLRHGQPRCVCSTDCSTPSSRTNDAALNRVMGAMRGGGGIGSHLGSGVHGGPVCAFDGRTYRSQCSLSRYNCRFNREAHVEYNGRCQNSCTNVSCPADKSCVQDQNGVPHCINCVTDCPPAGASSERVCGGDGRTYQSPCHLERQVCRTGRSIRLAYRGECRAGLTCSRLPCADHERCLMNEQTRTPVCVACDRPCYALSSSDDAIGAMMTGGVVFPRRDLCATDGSTYRSYCDMWRTACERGVVIDARHAGPCESATGDDFDSFDDYSDAGQHVELAE